MNIHYPMPACMVVGAGEMVNKTVFEVAVLMELVF